MLRAGFIGAGDRAQSAHYPNVARLEGVRVEAVSELDEARARDVMERYRIPRYFDDYGRMLESMELDLVYVIMGPELVTPIAVECLNAGKHVFIEKPPGGNLADAQRLLDAAVANDVWCMVGYQRRYAAVVREAMRRVALRGGATLAIGEFHKYLPQGPSWHGVSTLWSDISHVVDLVRYMVGSEAVAVNAYQDTHGWDWTNDYNALVRFANGAVGIFSGNRSSGGRLLRLELHGTGVGCYIKLPEPLEVYEDGNGPHVITGSELEGTASDDRSSFDGVLAMHRHFRDCILNGGTPLTDIRDVIHTALLLHQLEGNSP